VSTVSPVAEGFWFLRKFLRAPGHVASFWPSSRWLAAAMVRDLVLPPGSAVLELGPGTGPFTAAITAHLRPAPGCYLGIDRDPEFVAVLRSRFPAFEFCCDDVARLAELLAARAHLRPGVVLCGLPLVSMPVPVVDRLLQQVAGLLPPGGVFRTFSYVHTMANPASWKLRARMRGFFGAFAVHGPVLRNVPPALVFEGRS
jgi:phospholipid N-methyltransferase